MSKKFDHDPDTGEIIDVEEFIRAVSQSDERLDARGREIPDPVPLAPPVGYVRAPTMVDIIRAQIRSAQLAQEVEAAGLETFEEADDFVVEDFDPSSPYEEIFDPRPRDPFVPNAVEQLDPRRIAEENRLEAERAARVESPAPAPVASPAPPLAVSPAPAEPPKPA